MVIVHVWFVMALLLKSRVPFVSIGAALNDGLVARKTVPPTPLTLIWLNVFPENVSDCVPDVAPSVTTPVEAVNVIPVASVKLP